MSAGAPGETPDPRSLLPHGPPAAWIEEVLERAEGELTCRGRIPAASPFARGGTAPATAGLELAAQVAAVLEALERSGSGSATGSESGAAPGPRRGYLVRVREVSLATVGIPRGAPLIARVRRSGGAPPLAIYEVAVHREVGGGEGEEICRGTLGTWLAAEPPESGGETAPAPGRHGLRAAPL